MTRAENLTLNRANLSARLCENRARHGALRFFAAASLVGAASAQDVELELLPTRWRSSFEYLEAGADVEVGVLGLHYDFLDVWSALPGAYIGVGGYGALLGERGGFFAGGFSLGFTRPFSRTFALDLGTFIGAGGSDEGESAGGLLLRPYAALERRLSSGAGVRVEVSHVTQPDGDLVSTQVGLGITDIDALLTADWAIEELIALERGTVAPGNEAVSIGYGYFKPSSRTEFQDGSDYQEDLSLAVLSYEQPLGGAFYLPLELAGAIDGDAAGYMQALLGLGVRLPLYGDDVFWRLQGQFGAAGGAQLDTGGGLISGGKTGFEIQATEYARLHVLGGYLAAATGEFDGFTIDAGVSWTPKPLRPAIALDRLESTGMESDELRLDTWNLQVLHQSLLPRSSSTLTTGERIEEDIQMIGVGFENSLNENFNIALRGFGAWDGEVGGYHEGQLGLFYKLDALKVVPDPGSLYLMYLLGTGGGGDVDLRDGPLQRFGVGWRRRLRPGFAIGFEFAHFDAASGGFRGEQIGLSLSWDLTVPLSTE